MRKTIMIYSDLLFEDDIRYIASTGRFINIAQAIEETGREVTIFAYSKESVKSTHEYAGLTVHYFPQYNGSGISDFLKSGNQFLENIESAVNLRDFDEIIYYGTSLKFSYPIKKISVKNRIKTISLVNEWGSFSNRLKSLPNYLVQKMGIYYVRSKFDGVIPISTFMDAFFKKKNNIKTFVIPSIFDFSKLPNRCIERDINSPITISYAGTIANGKDSMAVILEAMCSLCESDLERLRVKIYGSSIEQVEHALGEKSDYVLSKLSETVVFKGHYDRETLQKELVYSDFGILIRPSKSYSNAGFPTKFAEAMALGVPMIANSTSDISKYLINGKNGILVSDDSLDSVIYALQEMLILNDTQLNQMRFEAYRTAKESFDYKGYVKGLDVFLESL